MSGAREALDPTVNKNVLCPHNMLGLRPLGRVVPVSQQCWNAVLGSFPHAIHLPYHRISNTSSSCRNDSDDLSEDSVDCWLCPDCLNEKQEGVDETYNQKASRTLELTDPNLLSLYNSMRSRNKKKSRGVQKAPKKVVDSVEGKNEDMIINIDEDAILPQRDDNRYKL